MGIKSDAEILQSLADHHSSQAGEADTADDPTEGVGEAIPDTEEGDEPEVVEDEEDGEPEDEDSEEDDEESGEEAEEEESDDEEDESEEDEDEPEDDAADKEIARIQQAEKEAKERISAQVEELKAKQSEVDERLAKAEQLEADNAKRSKRFASAPIAFGKKHGLETPEDFMALGSKYYRYGKGLAPDAKPELKQWAAAAEREGEQESSVDELRAEIQALKDERESEKKAKETEAETSTKEAEAKKALDDFADEVTGQASSAYPIASKLIADLSEEERRDGIVGVATYLAKRNGSPPTADQIFEEIETEERKRLTRLGIDPDERFPRKKTKAKPGNASKKKKAPVTKKTKTKKESPRQKTDAEILESLKKRREKRKSA